MTFDSAQPGTPAAVWRADGRLAALPGLALPSRPIVVLAAHPDDETLGAGGLLAAASRAGLDVTVVVVTDGAAGGAGTVPPGELRRRRAAEVRAALRTLGVAREIELLDFADGEIREDRTAVAAAVDRVLASVEAREGRRPLLVSTWIGDGHRDHRVLGEIAGELAADRGLELWQYPIWMWHWGDPSHPDVPWDALTTFGLDDGEMLSKAQALRAFVSQTTPHDGAPAMLRAEFLEHFASSSETFVASSSSAPGATSRRSRRTVHGMNSMDKG